MAFYLLRSTLKYWLAECSEGHIEAYVDVKAVKPDTAYFSEAATCCQKVDGNEAAARSAARNQMALLR